MRLWAISDLHLSHPGNRGVLNQVPAHRDDWLIVAGDIGDGYGHLARCFDVLCRRFKRVIWTPGNHDLWSRPGSPSARRGVELYRWLVEIARRHGVLTPEDPYPVFPHPEGDLIIAPLFLLFDYSFRPDDVRMDDVVRWARQTDIVAADEYFLRSDPFRNRAAWCAALCAAARQRLAACPADLPKILVNHYPLEESLAVLPRAPRFAPWCGTRLTRGWHIRFNARAVVYGHLHIRGTRWLDRVPFQEVSLGYPTQWHREFGVAHYLHEVEPGPASPPRKPAGR